MAKEINKTRKALLLDVEKIERLINDSPDLSKEQKNYLRDRWLERILWWNSRSRWAKRLYFSSRCVIVVGSILVPYLTSASFSEQTDPSLRRAGSIVSLIVAACAGIEALFGWGGIWLEKRRATELLTIEGWLFLQSAGQYKNKIPAGSFPEFVTEVESKIASEIGEYVAIAQRGQGSQGAGAQIVTTEKPPDKKP
jgi:hypothetical protein